MELITGIGDEEYERHFINWKRLHSERPREGVVTLEGTVSTTESCETHPRGAHIFSLKEYRLFRFWFFREADYLSYRACLRGLKPGCAVRLIVWRRVDRLSPVCFVRVVDLMGRIPGCIEMTITYSDETRRRIKTSDSVTVLELMWFMAQHSANVRLRDELTFEASKLCRACGAEAASFCAECGAPICAGSCEHRHVGDGRKSAEKLS